MDGIAMIVMTALGMLGSFLSGLLGIGGAIINYPLLLYVPAWTGVAHYTAHEVSSISMFQVFFSSLAGVWAYRKKNKNGPSPVNRELVLYMGSGILAGSLIGGFVSGLLRGDAINLTYGILAVIAVMLMLVPRGGGADAEPAAELRFPKAVAAGAAFAVGVVSGIVGAGGAFILIPIMLTVLRIPLRTTIASSLAIVMISAIGGVVGKMAGDIPLWPTVFTVIGSLIGASLGSRASALVNVKVLRRGLVLLIAATAVKIWASIL
ncbi:sulfite exporter TauE/SafE family protein [Paenibacillus cymbidii]|uniref:sulfite exporter TauE/SafE family protein n=1 Tax=Paenibacillus cymbidii TaxID=1639034 RepID=UPI001081B415|nr:sulfite exporter TauE/SafE family protein [Paenibacillus cymbidii]